jgi:alcohol dehydrogenase
MLEISLGRIPAISGGAGALARLPALLQELTDARRLVVLIDPGLQAAGHSDTVAALLKAQGLQPLMAALPPGEPKEATVDALVAEAHAHGASAVVCIGGGSTMDAGKLVANLASGGGTVARYRLAATPLPKARLPLICVPSTAGTGAEATAVSVLSSADGVKYWFWGPTLKPDQILHDPEIMTGLPAAITAATGVDALVHAMEAATNLNATPLNNLFAYRAIELVTRWLPVAVSEPGNLEARAAMLEAATLAGIAIDNAGTAIAHNIGHALGSVAAVPHGRAVAIGMAATLAWNVEAAPEVYEPVAAAMGLTGGAPALSGAFRAFLRQVGVDLAAPGLQAAELALQMAEPENAAMLRSNRRDVAADDLRRHAEAVVALAR